MATYAQANVDKAAFNAFIDRQKVNEPFQIHILGRNYDESTGKVSYEEVNIVFSLSIFFAFGNSRIAVRHTSPHSFGWSKIEVFPDLHDGIDLLLNHIRRTAKRLLNGDSDYTIQF
jgi:hypothetical protein